MLDYCRKMWLLQPLYQGHMKNMDANRILAAFNPMLGNGDRFYAFMRDLGLEIASMGQFEYEAGALSNTMNAFVDAQRQDRLVTGTVTVSVPASEFRLWRETRAAQIRSKKTGTRQRRKKAETYTLTQDFHYVCRREDEALVREGLEHYMDLGRGVRDRVSFQDTIEQYQDAFPHLPGDSTTGREYIRTAWITAMHMWFREVIPVFITLESERASLFAKLVERYAEVQT